PFRFAKEPKRATDVARLRRDLAEVKERASDVALVAGLGLRADRLLEEASCLVESAGDAEGRSEPSQRETEKDAIAERPSGVDPRGHGAVRPRALGRADATVQAERVAPFPPLLKKRREPPLDRRRKAVRADLPRSLPSRTIVHLRHVRSASAKASMRAVEPS